MHLSPSLHSEHSDSTICIYIYTYDMAVFFLEGSVTEPRRTFVTDLVTDFCNRTRWLVTHPSLHILVTHFKYAQTLSDAPWCLQSRLLQSMFLLKSQIAESLPFRSTVGTGQPATPLFAAVWLALNSCHQAGARRCALCRPRYIAVTDVGT